VVRIALEEEHPERRSDGEQAANGRKLGKRSVSVEIAGKQYRIRSDADEAWLHRLAGAVDDAMRQIRDRTDTVDSQEIAVLTALNLARELVDLRDQVAASRTDTGPPTAEAGAGASPDRLRGLIERVEGVLAMDAPDHES
jgi:cell division protein ZapA